MAAGTGGKGMKGIVFSIEALLSLLAAMLFLLFVWPQNIDLSYKSIYEYSLLQDFLETSVKNKEIAGKLTAFCEGSVDAKNFLATRYKELLDGVGSNCLKASCGKELLEVGCGEENEENGGRKKTVSGTRLLYYGNGFTELRFVLYFVS